VGDMTEVIAARSDQLNAVDLVGGPITITIISAVVRKGQDQPVTVSFEGDDGKPWKPSKTASRIMAALWGPNSDTYAGRSVTLFRDPTVQWGGKEVGGILISHMSHIGKVHELNLIERRGVMKTHRIEPLAGAPMQTDDGSKATADELIRRAQACDGPDALNALANRDAVIKRRDWLREVAPDLADQVDEAFRIAQPEPGADTVATDNPTAAEGPADEDRGEDHGDEPHPAQAAVDAHLKRIMNCALKSDVDMAIMDFSANKAALPDDMRQEVEDAEHNRLMQFSTAAAG